MNRVDANELLVKMKALASEAKHSPNLYQVDIKNANGGANFSDVFQNAIQSVNDLQSNATQLINRFEANDNQVSVSEVMIAMQKASLSFQALTQVRNQVVNAYQDIMNMPI